MAEIEQQEIPFQEGRLLNRRRRRGIFLLPSLFTAANLFCGYYAIVATLLGTSSDFDHAAIAIGLAVVFDSLDGRVARMTGTSTQFGVQFDSLADVVSFGVAPALMAYSWGVHGLHMTPGGMGAFVGDLAWGSCLLFLICCAWRLARFNVQGMAPGSSKYFVGMPTPAAAGVVAALVHGFKAPLHDWRWSIAWLLMVGGLGGLMTSTIRYSSFKEIPWKKKQPSLAIVLLILLLWIIWKFSETVLIVLACSYAVIGVALHLLRIFRLRAASRTA
jgi:CDP-diacylglycerol---serine O-phosphatidyltransferase